MVANEVAISSPRPIDAEPAETAAVSRDEQQDVFGCGSARVSGTVRWTGEVAAEKILVPLDADGGSAHTPWHRVRGSTGTGRGAVSCGRRLALVAGWRCGLPWLSGLDG